MPAAFALGATGLAYGFGTNNPLLIILSFFVLLLAFALLLHHDYEEQAIVVHRPMGHVRLIDPDEERVA